MRSRKLLLLLLICGATAVGLARLLVGFDTLLQPQIDVPLHNTYLVLPPYQLVLALLLLMLLLALAGTVVWRKSPQMGSMLLVAVSLSYYSAPTI